MAKKSETPTVEKSKVEILDGNVVKVDIKIPAKVAQEVYEKTLRRISANINIAGFRKGKAPRGVVEKYVSTDRVKAEALEGIFPTYFGSIVDEHSLDLATQPYIETYDFEVGKDLDVVVKVELKPVVELGEYKGISVEYEEFVPDKDTVQKELEVLRGRFAALEPVTRKAKATDTIVFDFEGFKDGVPFEHGSAKGYTMDLANSGFIPGFAEQLVGHKAGEEFTINVTFPEEYHSAELKGAAAEFKIKIHEVKEKVLPELNDELAKKAGKFETLEALKTDIETFVKENAEKENSERKTNAAFQKAVANAKVDIQKTMIDREVKALKEESKSRLEQSGHSWDDMVMQEGGEAAINEKMATQAAERIKNTLFIEKVAKDEEVQISQQDMMEEIETMARSYGAKGADMLRQLRNNPSAFSVISQQVAMKKVRQLILENAKFKTAKAKKK
jgi:trigger factor